MPEDKKNTPEGTDPALQNMALEIARLGSDEDGALTTLAKGMTSAYGHLADITSRMLPLLKAVDGDEGDEVGDNGGEGGDEGGDTDSAPGYEDMNLGDPTGYGSLDPQDAGNGGVDVSQFVMDQAARTVRLEKATSRLLDVVGRQSAQIAELRKANAALGEMVAKSAEANAAVLAPLAKAVAETHDLLERTPAPGITPANFPRPRKPRGDDAKLIGGNSRLEGQALMKAVRSGVIDLGQRVNFQRTRRFVEDEEQNAAIRAQVEEVAASFGPRTASA